MSTSIAAPGARPRHARRAVGAAFLVCGTVMSSWAPMVPYARARLGLDDGTLGAVLLSLGLGGLLTLPLTGLITERLGSRGGVLAGGLMVSVVLPLLAVAPGPLSLAALLFLFGASIGVLDMGMNAQAVAVEAGRDRPVMSSLHGLYSVGGIVGSLGMTGLLAAGLPLAACAAGVGGVMAALVLTQQRDLLPERPERRQGRSIALPRGPALPLSVLCCVAFLSEGAVLDWGALLLRFFHGYAPAMAGLGYAAFSVAMAAARLGGDAITVRIGPRRTVVSGATLAAAGLLAAVLAPWPPAALAGFVLVGLGAANIVPVLFSATGRLPDMRPSMALPAVATLGYAGVLVGPALIGFVARASTLPAALTGVAMLLLAAAFGAARTRVLG